MQRHPVYPLCRVPFMQDVTIKLQYNTYHNYNVNIDNIDIKTVKLQNISINISIPHVVLLQPLTLLPIPPLPEPLKTIPLFAIFIIFSVQEYFYTWNHTVSNLLELTFFLQHISLEMHPGCCVYYQSWSLFIAEQQFTTWEYHILFNHLPIERHVSCFQYLTMTNKAFIGICVQVFM